MLSKLKKFSWPTIGLICVFGVVLVGWILPPILWPGGIGIGKDSPASTKAIEKDARGKTIKTIETIKDDDGKTLWDWGSLLGVPLSLAILGYVLQQEQQRRAEKLSEDQRKIADNEIREKVLQVYFDRLSALLINRNLIARSCKHPHDFPSIYPPGSFTLTLEEKELLDSSRNIIRARTLSILRRFEKDAERKTSVIKFLIETEIVGKLNLNLEKADLSGTNLKFVNLERANLKSVNFQGANLQRANLERADLSGAKLERADLSGADLYGADLHHANLERADLYGANLLGADLFEAYLSGANLSSANLSNANFPGVNLSGANLSMAHLVTIKLVKADLSGADLSGADLSGAYLIETDFSGADFSGADLSGADLRWTKLQGSNLEDIKWDSKTVWPDERFPEWPEGNPFNGAKNIPEELKKELGITP
ncbi:MAG: pentapeptide repeat-containing protein [Snowella sp.]